MTAKRANRINGLDHKQHCTGWWHACGADGLQVAGVTYLGSDSAKALKMLVEEVYRINRNKAMERDEWKCVKCGSYRNLQAHHKVHRGMGGANRDDRVESLETLCAGCHSKEHGG